MNGHAGPLPPAAESTPSLMPAGLLLGVGLGGFVDGIVFHQILQLHAMLSARIPVGSMPGMRVNMLADGLFHAVVWTATLLGVIALWRALNRPLRHRPRGAVLAGAMLAGWGWFNLLEGAIDHHLLHLHHVVEKLGVSVWDWAFLASGAVFIVAGHAIARRASHHQDSG